MHEAGWSIQFLSLACLAQPSLWNLALFSCGVTEMGGFQPPFLFSYSSFILNVLSAMHAALAGYSCSVGCAVAAGEKPLVLSCATEQYRSLWGS